MWSFSDDSDEQVREKVHGIFACSERQSNWRSSFTPSKNSLFSRQQLTSLYCQAATVIANVFIEIASNPHAATPLPRRPGQRRNCSFWLLPNLFGGVACSCQWCEQHLNQPSTSSSSSLFSRGRSYRTTAPAVIFQNVRGNVTEWMVSVCQSSVSGELGSNACTIIAVLVVVNFCFQLAGSFLVHKTVYLSHLYPCFKELMVEGNIIHQWIGHAQQNYSVPEVIQHPSLGFSGVARCGDEYQFPFFQQFAAELESIINTHQAKLALVLILPPDKSMVLLVGELGQLVLLESHWHQGVGGVVAATGPQKVKEMVFYIDYMAKRDWGGNPVPFDVSFVQVA